MGAAPDAPHLPRQVPVDAYDESGGGSHHVSGNAGP